MNSQNLPDTLLELNEAWQYTIKSCNVRSKTGELLVFMEFDKDQKEKDNKKFLYKKQSCDKMFYVDGELNAATDYEIKATFEIPLTDEIGILMERRKKDEVR